ncbi:MAG: DoxX family protein [Phycisphaerales bacterium JB039]
MSWRPGPRESWALLVVRLALAGVFTFAAYQKLKSPAALLEFRQAIEAFKLIDPDRGAHLIQVATYAIPWAEVLCALLLVLGRWTRAAVLLLTLALGGFVAAILSALDRGLSFPCGCFGKINWPCSSQELTMCGVYRNAAIAAPALYLLIRGAGSYGADILLGPRRRAPAFEESTPPPPARAREPEPARPPKAPEKPKLERGSAGTSGSDPGSGMIDVPGT